jgi:hypothetical protein
VCKSSFYLCSTSPFSKAKLTKAAVLGRFNIERRFLRWNFTDAMLICILSAIDFDRNGTVSARDLRAFLAGFGDSGDCTVDLNGDFMVDASDLLIFLGLFGNDCE